MNKRPPMLTFLCHVTYTSRAGARKDARLHMRAIAADLAVDAAIDRVKRDKRRSVTSITYADAVQA